MSSFVYNRTVIFKACLTPEQMFAACCLLPREKQLLSNFLTHEVRPFYIAHDHQVITKKIATDYGGCIAYSLVTQDNITMQPK